MIRGNGIHKKMNRVEIEYASVRIVCEQIRRKSEARFRGEPNVVFPKNRHAQQSVIIIKRREKRLFVAQKIAVIFQSATLEEIEQRRAAHHRVTRYASCLRIEREQLLQFDFMLRRQRFGKIGMHTDFEERGIALLQRRVASGREDRAPQIALAQQIERIVQNFFRAPIGIERDKNF